MKVSPQALTSFLIWTSVFVTGVLFSGALFRAVLGTLFHFVHS
jgi:hypothetical protein